MTLPLQAKVVWRKDSEEKQRGAGRGKEDGDAVQPTIGQTCDGCYSDPVANGLDDGPRRDPLSATLDSRRAARESRESLGSGAAVGCRVDSGRVDGEPMEGGSSGGSECGGRVERGGTSGTTCTKRSAGSNLHLGTHALVGSRGYTDPLVDSEGCHSITTDGYAIGIVLLVSLSARHAGAPPHLPAYSPR